MAVFTFVQNFRYTSPYADMLPAGGDYLSHPIDSVGQLIHVIQLTENHQSEIVAEKRKRKVDDVAKRNIYRKAHGIEGEGFLSKWIPKDEENKPEPTVVSPEDGDGGAEQIVAEEQKPKKRFGLF